MKIFIVACLLAISYAQTVIPCIHGANKPAGCVQRIKPCSSFSSSELDGLQIINENENYDCGDATPKMKDTLFTGASTNTYFVKFKDDETDECYGIIMEAGECWGDQPNTGSNYDCQGRCGAGCSNGEANWARDCLKHDACSWYFSASGGLTSKTCGDEFEDATNDFLSVGSACKTSGASCNANKGKWFEDNKERVCYKDKCKGTWTNAIPRGKQWVNLRMASESGCCAGNTGACDWCSPPAPTKQMYQIIGSDQSHQIADYFMAIFAIFGVLTTVYIGVKRMHKIFCKRSDFRKIDDAEVSEL